MERRRDRASPGRGFTGHTEGLLADYKKKEKTTNKIRLNKV